MEHYLGLFFKLPPPPTLGLTLSTPSLKPPSPRPGRGSRLTFACAMELGLSGSVVSLVREFSLSSSELLKGKELNETEIHSLMELGLWLGLYMWYKVKTSTSFHKAVL